MASSDAIISVFLILFCAIGAVAHASSEKSESAAPVEEAVVTLDHSNFTEFVAKHKFLVAEFYAPWCGACKQLAPEYEKAASILSKEDPQLVLVKVDATEEANKGLSTEYGVSGYPTIKILRYGGSIIHDFKGPRDADGIVAYVKKQSGPASVELKSAEEVVSFIGDKKLAVVGVFPEFSGEKFDNFTSVASGMRIDYDFGHVSDAKLLPRGESSVSGPFVRLFKAFDEPFVDFQEFHTDALINLIKESSIPTVTIFDNDPSNRPFVISYFNAENNRAMLFLNFSSENFDALKSEYYDVAKQYKEQGISFLIGDLDASERAFQYFGLKVDQVPLIFIHRDDGEKFLKTKVESGHIASWLKEFKDGLLLPFKKSQPIPEVNNEPVKVVVHDNLQDFVFNSGKNVLLEFYAPWCMQCQKFAPILDEVAVSFESDADVVIAKFDGTANDIPKVFFNIFDIDGFPKLYFKSASGKIVLYDGDRSKEDIIDFVKNNSEKVNQQESQKDEL